MRFKEIAEGLRDPKDNPCWKGYKPVGTKKKNGRTVPNCVPKANESEVEESGLQYYTGVKKHGKKYMKMAAAAARKGASQEELGRLKDKYSKAYKKDESADSYLESLTQSLQTALSEKAPPGDKYERMVKHIKKGYAKDGKLSAKEKSIAYATAWKAKNKEKK